MTTSTQAMRRLTPYGEVEVNEIAEALNICAKLQRTYGKQASDTHNIAKLFAHVLEDLDPELVIKAFKVWINRSPEYPTPYDIRKIVEPQKRLPTIHEYSKAYDRYTQNGHNKFTRDYDIVKAYETSTEIVMQ